MHMNIKAMNRCEFPVQVILIITEFNLNKLNTEDI